jgi:hypothetical protein
VPTKIPAASLDELLAFLQGPGRDLPEREWTRLPTFGGEEPESTNGVWSWDADRLLVGACASELRIVRRPREVSILIRLRSSEHEALRAGAERAGLPLGTWLRDLGLREAKR